MPALHLRLPGHLQAEAAPAHPHRGEAVRVRDLPRQVHPEQLAQGPQADPHGRQARVPVRALPDHLREEDGPEVKRKQGGGHCKTDLR